MVKQGAVGHLGEHLGGGGEVHLGAVPVTTRNTDFLFVAKSCVCSCDGKRGRGVLGRNQLAKQGAVGLHGEHLGGCCLVYGAAPRGAIEPRQMCSQVCEDLGLVSRATPPLWPGSSPEILRFGPHMICVCVFGGGGRCRGGGEDM